MSGWNAKKPLFITFSKVTFWGEMPLNPCNQAQKEPDTKCPARRKFIFGF